MKELKIIKKIVLTNSFLISVFFYGCNSNEDEMTIKNTIDISSLEVGQNDSYSNFKKAKIEQLHLDLDVKFKSKMIYGIARYKLQKHYIDTITLDVKGLQIQKVTIGKSGHELNTDYLLGIEDSIHGAPLSIKINKSTRYINIYYQSTEKPTNLHWLYDSINPKLSSLYLIPGEKYTRNWIPIQDLNNFKIDFSSEITNDLNLTPLFGSANNLFQLDSNRYFYKSPSKINLYDIGFFMADFSFKKIHKNQTIYYLNQFTSSNISKEFSSYFQDLNHLKRIYGKHPWNEFNIVILPPKFPYRSFDLPNLSFIHPVNLGNFKNSNDFIQDYLFQTWPHPIFSTKCNKNREFIIGFNKYLSVRTKKYVVGNETEEMEIKNYIEQNRFRFKKLNTPLLRLKNIYGKSCDTPDQFTYKSRLNLQLNGFLFANELEKLIGEHNFESFIKKQTQQTNLLSFDDFERELKYYLIKREILDFNPIAWFNDKTPVKSLLNIKSKRHDRIHKICKLFSYQRKFSKIKKFKQSVKNFTIYDWSTFISLLPTGIKEEKLDYLDYKYHFSTHPNKNIQKIWFFKSITLGYLKPKENIRSLLEEYGDIETNVQFYQLMLSSPRYINVAKEIYSQNLNTLHPETKKALEPLFKRF